MRKHKKKLLLVSIAGLAVLGSMLGNTLIKEEGALLPSTRNQTLAVYIEDENSETGYSKSDSTQFPTEGYILNIEKSTCTNGGVLNQDTSTKKISLSVEHKSSCSLYFDKDIKADSSTTLAKLGKGVKEGSPAFGSAATTDETSDGLYAMEDDYGTSYYYRGAATDNYVKFAGFYWRIIQVNGDGSLRIIYDGTQAHRNGTSSTNRLLPARYNSEHLDAKYVGYMFGGENGKASTSKEEAQTNTTNSSIKMTLENWYKTNIADKGYDNHVSDNIFCNDRSIPGKEKTEWSFDTGLGYGGKVTGYGALSRIMTGNNSTTLSAKDNPTPKFICENKNDAFTKEDTNKGNGKLGEKVGLITADEIVVAGSGKYGTTNSNYYLYKGSLYWSLSPAAHEETHATSVFAVHNLGAITDVGVSNYYNTAPVINLTAEYVSTMSGNGTMSSPFEA